MGLTTTTTPASSVTRTQITSPTVGAQAHNRVPVIKISQSSPLPSRNTFQKILPQPITLIPVSRLQNIKKVDPSNNIEKIAIKTEPAEETDQSTVTTIPFHDFA